MPNVRRIPPAGTEHPTGVRRLSPGGLTAALCTVVGLVCASRSLVLALSLSTPVPIADQWEFVFDLLHLNEEKYSLLELFSQHNEHRIFTARLSFFLDYYFFHLGNVSVVLTNYVLLGLLAALLTRLAYGSRDRLMGYAVPWRRRALSRALAGTGFVLGYDSWFKLDEGDDPRSMRLVMVFAGGNVPPCLAPDP